jgi:hypothetical protein
MTVAIPEEGETEVTGMEVEERVMMSGFAMRRWYTEIR